MALNLSDLIYQARALGELPTDLSNPALAGPGPSLPASLGGAPIGDLVSRANELGLLNEGGAQRGQKLSTSPNILDGTGQGGEGAGPNPSGGQLGSQSGPLGNAIASGLLGAAGFFGGPAMSLATGLIGKVGALTQTEDPLSMIPGYDLLGTTGVKGGLAGPLGSQAATVDINPSSLGLTGLAPGDLSAAAQTIGGAMSSTQNERGLSAAPSSGLQGPAGLGGELGGTVGGVASGGAIGAVGGAGEQGILGGGGVSIGGDAAGGGGADSGGPGSGPGSGGPGSGTGGLYDEGGIIPKTGKINAQKDEAVISKKAVKFIGKDTINLINRIAGHQGLDDLTKFMALHAALRNSGRPRKAA